MLAQLEKLETNLGGVENMREVPDAVFIIALKKEQLAVREARRLGLPIIALVDTNCDPDDADFVIPGNDDAISACTLVTRVVAEAVAEGRGGYPASAVAETNGKPDEAAVAPPEEPSAAASPIEQTPSTAPDTQADDVTVPDAALAADEMGETPVASPPAEES